MAEPLEIAPGITVDKNVHFGKPVVKGTRVPIAVVMGQLAAGATQEEIESEYGLSREDILSVLRYAADLLAEEEVRAS